MPKTAPAWDGMPLSFEGAAGLSSKAKSRRDFVGMPDGDELKRSSSAPMLRRGDEPIRRDAINHGSHRAVRTRDQRARTLL